MATLSVFGPGAESAQDLHLDAKGNIVVARGVEDVRQRVIEALKFERGSWYLAIRKGVPYKASVFTRPAFAAVLTEIVGQTILDVEGVDNVENVDITINKETRSMIYSADVTTNTGEQFSIGGESG